MQNGRMETSSDESDALDRQPSAQCPITHCLAIIGGKWKPALIFAILNGVNRFGALQRALPGITKQVLTQQLRELEAHGVLDRHAFAEIPPRVEYSLTDKGRTLLPIIDAKRLWGKDHVSS